MSGFFITRSKDLKVFKRNDNVVVFGKTWRIDHIDGSWLSISNDDNEQKVVMSMLLSILQMWKESVQSKTF